MALVHRPRNVCLSFPLGGRGWRIDNDETWLTFPIDSDDLILSLRIMPQVYWSAQNTPVLFTAACDGGVPPYTWTITGLPTGLIADSVGVISGTIPMGSYGKDTDVNVTFKVEDSATPTKATKTLDQPFSVIGDPLRIIPKSFTITAGVWFDDKVEAQGGVTPYIWMLTGLPSGIIQFSDGTLQGVVLANEHESGTIFEVSCEVTDHVGTTKTLVQNFFFFIPGT